MDGHVSCELGEKVYRPLNVEPENVDEFDCSGFIKYVVQRTTLSHVSLPAGSYHQETWCEENLIRCDYTVDAPCQDGSVLIAFRDRPPALIRHVWLVINGWSFGRPRGRRGSSSSLRRGLTGAARFVRIVARLSMV
jgi:hypothetical protein